MGKSLCVLHDTKLKFLDIEQTAKQISLFFKKNVSYRTINYDLEIDDKSFINQFENFKHLESFPDEEFLCVTREFFATQDDFCYEVESEDINFDLHPSCINNLKFFIDWYFFNRNFLFKKDSSLDKIVKDFRQKVYRQVQLFGGKEALYFSESNVPEAIYENINWTDLKSKIFKENKGDILDIPEFFQKKEQERLNYPVYMDRALTSEEFDKILNEGWQLNVGIRDDYMVLFDDFRDLI